jgi:PAS domain S-box-containing protein
MRENSQIFATINMGLVVLDRELTVTSWNQWMVHHSGISGQDIIGQSILGFYPNLAEPKYRRLLNSVFSFGNYAYFSQKLHRYLFSMKNPYGSADTIPFMQQSCTAGPIRDSQGELSRVFISVEDVTETVFSELLLKDKVRQLEEALATVRMLEGIIPICMYCKKIRDDEESWQQMERYITEHSSAEFSHGICPDCFSKRPWMQG